MINLFRYPIPVLFLFSVCQVRVAQAVAAPCPNNPTISGYSDWEQLKQSLYFGTTKVLCPGMAFYVDKEVTISKYAIFQCGLLGQPEDSCVILGGDRQLKVTMNGAHFRGVTFRGAMSAVSVNTNDDSETVFDNCIFEDNNSVSEPALGAVGNIYGGSRVLFRECIFQRNVGFKTGGINVEGYASFEHCTFDENWSIGDDLDIGGSAIYVNGVQGKIEVSNSCFLRNIGASVIFLRSRGPEMVANHNNYGEGNISTLFSCPAVFHDEDGACEAFEAPFCGLTWPSSMPSSYPSIKPTGAPSSAPSTHPSLRPSSSPSSAPTFLPTTSPSSAPSGEPLLYPSDFPSAIPSDIPFMIPSLPPETSSMEPSIYISISSIPSSLKAMPSVSVLPSESPSWLPTRLPSEIIFFPNESAAFSPNNRKVFPVMVITVLLAVV